MKRIEATLSDTSAFNAHASATRKRDRYSISVNAPLSFLVSGVAALVTKGINEQRSPFVSRVLAFLRMQPSWEEQSRRLIEACLSTDCDSLSVPTRSLGIRQSSDWALITESTELFIVGHEVGHIVMWEVERLLRNGSRDIATTPLMQVVTRLDPHFRRTLRQVLLNAGALPRSQEVIHMTDDDILEKWVVEVKADLIGTYLSQSAADNDVMRRMAYVSPHFTFRTLRLLRDIRRRAHGNGELVSTHPAPEVRSASYTAALLFLSNFVEADGPQGCLEAMHLLDTMFAKVLAAFPHGPGAPHRRV